MYTRISNSRSDRRLLGTEIATTIRGQILNGLIKPGDHLGLVPLAEKMGTSITPVREALLQLAQDGWIIHEPHRGFRVAPLNREELTDTYFMWATAEGEIARRAAERAGIQHIAILKDLDTSLRTLENHNSSSALQLNQDFHSFVHSVSKASKLVWFATSSMRSVPLQFNEAFQFIPGWADLNRYGHTKIVEAIETGDAASAASITREHFLSAGNLLVDHLDSMHLWAD